VHVCAQQQQQQQQQQHSNLTQRAEAGASAPITLSSFVLQSKGVQFSFREVKRGVTCRLYRKKQPPRAYYAYNGQGSQLDHASCYAQRFSKCLHCATASCNHQGVILTALLLTGN
jgi:hypothetical protein